MLLLTLLVYLVVNATSTTQESKGHGWEPYVAPLAVSQSLWLIVPQLSLGGDKLVLMNGYLSLSILTGAGMGLCLLISWMVMISWPVKQSVDETMMMGMCLVGSLLLTAAGNVTSLLIAVEMQSFGAYLLVGCGEGGVKKEGGLTGALLYFLLGALASAFLVLGFAGVYAECGLQQLSLISWQNAKVWSGALVFAGLVFKVGGAPLHFWTPAVYGLLSNRKMAYISVVPKVGAFVALVNMKGLLDGVLPMVWTFSAISLLVGAVGGLEAFNFRKLMAFSSINHVGYILMICCTCLESGGLDGAQSILIFYLIQYAVTLVLALLVVTDTSRQKDINGGLTTHQKTGLSWSLAAVAFSISLFSMAGVPPFVGFFSKYFVFLLSFEAGNVGLVVVGLVSSLVTAYYYLRVIGATCLDGVHSVPLWRGGGGDPVYSYSVGALLFTLGAVVMV